MIVVGYLFSTLNYILYCIGRFTKKKSAIMLYCLFALVMAGISNYCFGSLTGSLTLFVQIPIVFLSYCKEKKPMQKRTMIFVYSLAVLATTIILATTFKGLSSILIYVAANLSIYSYWWMSEQQLRVTGVFIGVLFFLYCMSIRNYMGFMELLVILSNIVSYAVYQRKKSYEVKSVMLLEESDK